MRLTVLIFVWLVLGAVSATACVMPHSTPAELRQFDRKAPAHGKTLLRKDRIDLVCGYRVFHHNTAGGQT